MPLADRQHATHPGAAAAATTGRPASSAGESREAGQRRRLRLLGDLSGHADVLARAAHERLGSASPAALLRGSMLGDLCRAASEALVVLDANASYLRWRPCWPPAAYGPLLLRASASPLCWRWRSAPCSAVVCGAAAARLPGGLVLASGGSEVLAEMVERPPAAAAAPSRLFDAGLGVWVPCAVPPLGVAEHVAVSHEGRYYAVGGYRTADSEGNAASEPPSPSLRLLADDGSRWSAPLEGGLQGRVHAACSLAGSLWALVDAAATGEQSGSVQLSRCDPREGFWHDAGSAGLRGPHVDGDSMAACGHSLCTVGGVVGPAQRPRGPAAGAQCQRVDVRMARAWQAMASLGEGRSWCGLACLEGRQVLVAVGGNSGGGLGDLQSVELWVPAVDKWFAVPPLPMPCHCIHSTTVALSALS
eukprot:m51a1_g14126 hypothetical protein (418) ;mRNA; f:203944-205197